jgi:hypothetical protein
MSVESVTQEVRSNHKHYDSHWSDRSPSPHMNADEISRPKKKKSQSRTNSLAVAKNLEECERFRMYSQFDWQVAQSLDSVYLHRPTRRGKAPHCRTCCHRKARMTGRTASANDARFELAGGDKTVAAIPCEFCLSFCKRMWISILDARSLVFYFLSCYVFVFLFVYFAFIFLFIYIIFSF